MLTINTWNDKLAAAWIDFLSCSMLDGTCLSKALENLQDTSEDEDTSSEGSSDGGSDDGQDLDAVIVSSQFSKFWELCTPHVYNHSL